MNPGPLTTIPVLFHLVHAEETNARDFCFVLTAESNGESQRTFVAGREPQCVSKLSLPLLFQFTLGFRSAYSLWKSNIFIIRHSVQAVCPR